ncbi:hypothetical protein Acr_23g0011150 [Actinidia rufa]|uniref:Uncharacterized protein n=1 Tax=Actinidia rufa TaxID=165716 RepID=A0A7J0GPI8_9ERIC|nr:hypothetical protein Acr_23g0011150 [Actinidia rufa]
MGPKRGRARMAGRGRGGRGATGQGTPIEDVGDQGVASQTQQGVDRGVTSHSRCTQQGADLVNTEAKKCKRFENGLNPSFRLYVISQRIRNFSDLLDCARRVEPKREQRKEFKGSWELRQMSVGTSSTTSGSFSKKRQRDSTQGSIGQQMFGASIPASSPKSE